MRLPNRLTGKVPIGLIFAFALLVHLPARAATVDVSISGFAFSPPSISVPAGTTVRWTNNHSVKHTSTADGGLWNSGTLTPGQQFSFTFNTPGTYPYHCAIHLEMVGTVTVTATPFSQAPALSPFGAGLLVLLLISTAIWFLRRRRAAGAR